jgi:hypothetical protein
MMILMQERSHWNPEGEGYMQASAERQSQAAVTTQGRSRRDKSIDHTLLPAWPPLDVPIGGTQPKPGRS